MWLNECALSVIWLMYVCLNTKYVLKVESVIGLYMALSKVIVMTGE